MLAGNVVPNGANPIAQAYAGHQFGGYSPRLGDGRALLLGEVFDINGHRRDLHLKGSGRTPFARGGDGKAAVGPMLREYLIGESLHALGIPTTRALAVVATGEDIYRDGMVPGAVLTRIAASHLRVGSFQYAAANDDATLLARLADYAIARHYPAAFERTDRYLALLESVVAAQASLIAHWMLVGFIHGVMNTDNMTISGESIDFGPCAFMDEYDATTVFSSIDNGGRYAYGNQPAVAQWNLARFAETLLPLIDADQGTAIELATEVLKSFVKRYDARWHEGLSLKLGLNGELQTNTELLDDFIELLSNQRVDFTSSFRALSSLLRGEASQAHLLFEHSESFNAWTQRWQQCLAGDPLHIADAMDHVNPLYIPRNHLVEEALADAMDDDMGRVEHLVSVLTQPFEARPGLHEFERPAPSSFRGYRTFCGT